MTPQEVLEFYGNSYKFKQQTGMSDRSLVNWISWGYIPEGSQYKIERLTKGKLKAGLIGQMKIDNGRKKITYEAKQSLKDHIRFIQSLIKHLTGKDETSKAKAVWTAYCLHNYLENGLISDVEKAIESHCNSND